MEFFDYRRAMHELASLQIAGLISWEDFDLQLLHLLYIDDFSDY